MPELPEVEFSARRLREWTLGRTIERAWAEGGSPLRSPDKDAFITGLTGCTIQAIRRIGKQMFIDLRGPTGREDLVLLVHLGMTGKFLKRRENDEVRKGTRVSLFFARADDDDGLRIDYFDPRRFGHLHLIPAEAADAHPVMVRLGPDALILCQTEGGLGLARVLGTTRRPVKVALMDQQRLAGVGNIYAAEALYLAGVDPWRPANAVTDAEWGRVAAGVITTMGESLARETDDEIRYLQDRDASNPFLVYGNAGSPCGRCDTVIERAVQAQRATFWCRRCQPAADPQPGQRSEQPAPPG